MKTVGIIYENIEMVLRKEKRGSLKLSQIQTAIRIGIINYFNRQLQLFRMSGEITTPLRPLITSESVEIINSVGALPAGFTKEVSFYVPASNSNPAGIYKRDKFEEEKNSVIMPPTETDPIGTLQGGTIVVRPQSIEEIILTFIKRPQDIVIGYSVSDDQRSLSYNDASTTDTEFSPEYASDLIKEALMYLGVPTQDEGAISLAQTVNP